MGKSILINAISARNGGGVTYIKNILPHIEEHIGNNHISVIISDDNIELDDIGKINKIKVIKIKTPSNNLIKRSIFELISLPKIMRVNNFDILFTPGGTSLTLKSKYFQSVTMFRNVWPHYYSNSLKKSFKNILFEPFSFLKLKFLKRVIIFNCTGLDKTIYISDYGKQLINGKQSPKNQFKVIKHAINNIFFEKQELNPKFRLSPKKYIFYVSSFLPYKNHEELLDSFAIVRNEFFECPLVLIGKISSTVKNKILIKLKSLGIENNVIILEEVDPNTLASLYQNSLFNLFLSSCENCPNTMLEAMASNRPLLSSSKEPMPEFGNDNVTYCDPRNILDISEKLMFMKKNIYELEAKAKDARKSIEDKRGWGKTAIETLDFIIS